MIEFRRLLTIVSLSISVVVCQANPLFASSAVEWDILNTLQLQAPAVDVAISPDGRRIYVLTEQDEIIVYTSGIKESLKIKVGNQVDQIRIGPTGDTLILNNRNNMTLQVIGLDFIQDINIVGSPFKGPQDAPIVIAVFSDFE